MPLAELIDTLWNVNLKAGQMFYCNKSGINRYIMECKLNQLVISLVSVH